MISKSEIAIKVEGLSKKYTIGTAQEDRLRYALSSLWTKQKTEEVWALKDVSFEIKKGEVVGVIGRNGAGKSTLLKILSKITKPTSGRAVLHGRVASLLEVGTGFHHELTGRENIYFNGNLLGLSRLEVKQRFEEIIDFSGVEKFIDTPVKHYSSGMYVRLAFSVAAHLNPEILLVDEVLAVGDHEFQQKCLGKMDDVAKSGRTVLLVSHNMEYVKTMSTSTLWVQDGSISTGESKDFINQYLFSRSNQNSILQVIDTNEIQVSNQEMNLVIYYRGKKLLERTKLIIYIKNDDGIVLLKANTDSLSSKFISLATSTKLNLIFYSLPLFSGKYSIFYDLYAEGGIKYENEYLWEFSVINKDMDWEPIHKDGVKSKHKWVL